MNEKHHCTVENAPKLLKWIAERGGIAIWKSINLSNPGGSWSSPATVRLSDCDINMTNRVDSPRMCPTCFGTLTVNIGASGDYLCNNCTKTIKASEVVVAYPKPNWQCAEKPDRIIRDAADVLVDVPKEVRRFHIAVRMGSQGHSLKVTDGGTRRIHEAVAKAARDSGKEAWYEFDYDEQSAVIYIADKTTPLNEWKP